MSPRTRGDRIPLVGERRARSLARQKTDTQDAGAPEGPGGAETQAETVPSQEPQTDPGATAAEAPQHPESER